ncbi:hydrogenase expression protein [Halorubraceae archaeon YAN]|nr:hydrogenase expression protein [Halorubraceae archaeon YAN]
MTLGKISDQFFHTHIAPQLGADRSDVALGPTHGVDFGVFDVNGAAVVTATDPISLLPELGFDRAGRFAVHIVLSDVAVSGLPPSHLSIAFALPTKITDAEFATFWSAIHAECERLDIAVVTGHTARYPGATYPWIGSATAMAVGAHADIIRPDGAKPGNEIVLTKGPAVEATGLFASLYPSKIPLSAEMINAASTLLERTQTVSDTAVARDAGNVTAMHDATEGGVIGAFHEMASSAGVQFRVDREAIPMQPAVKQVCTALDMDPWTATSSGTLLITTEAGDGEKVAAKLSEAGTDAAVVGTVASGTGVLIDGKASDRPTEDASWSVYATLSDNK